MQFKNLFGGFIIVGLVAAIIVMAAVQPNYDFNLKPETDVLKVSGQGKVTTMPDKAELFLNVWTEADNAVEAKELNSELSDAVFKALKGEDVDKDNIETYSFNIYPKRKWLEEEEQYIVVGYEVRHSVKVTTEEIDNVGKLIDVAVEAGANGVDRVSYTLTDETKMNAEEEALAMATEEAMDRAEAIADAAEVELKKLVTIDADTSYDRYYPLMEGLASARDESSTQLQPKSVEISASASLVYQIE